MCVYVGVGVNNLPDSRTSLSSVLSQDLQMNKRRNSLDRVNRRNRCDCVSYLGCVQGEVVSLVCCRFFWIFMLESHSYNIV